MKVRAIVGSAVFLFLSTYGAELYIRSTSLDFVSPTQPIGSLPRKERSRLAAIIEKEYGVVFDTRDQNEVIAELRNDGIAAIPQLILPTPEGDEIQPSIMPFSGVANSVTVVCNQNGEYMVYKSDDHGFNNPQLWSTGHFDMAAVGNSWTLGYCVPSGKNFVALIRNTYPATVNLGMPNEGPLHILGVLNEYVAVIRPKVVLWFFAEGSSLVELAEETRSPMLRRYLKDDFSQGLFHRQPEVAVAAKSLIDEQNDLEALPAPPAAEQSVPGMMTYFHAVLLKHFKEVAKLGAVRHKLGLVRTAENTRTAAPPDSERFVANTHMSLLRDIFSEARNRVRAWDGKLYVVYLPSSNRYFGIPHPSISQRSEILNTLSSLNIPIVDLHPVFQAHADPLSLFPFGRPGHANEEGHRLIAETVLSAISAR